MTDNPFSAFWEKLSQKVSAPPIDIDWADQISRMRQSFVSASQAIETDVPDMAQVRDIDIDGAAGPLTARIYTPYAAGVQPGPALVYFHGGGFVIGDIDSFDTICRRLADASRCRVMSVEYRLAPEHKFPAQIEDALAAWSWAAEHAQEWGADAERLAIGGDSAGANLCINILVDASTGRAPMPAFHLLIYPLVQFVDIREKKLKLHEGPFISGAIWNFFRKAYLPDGQDPMDPRISPLFFGDFSRFPPGHVITAGWDPLRDEGRAYAARLANCGVSVSERDYPAQPHGFFNMTPVSLPAREAVAEAGRRLARALAAR